MIARGTRPRRRRALSVALAAAMGSAAPLPVGAQPTQASPSPAISITAGQAIERTLANQPLIRQAEAALQAARARVGQAESAYYPNVSAGATYTRVEPDQSVTFPGLGTFSLAPVDNWDFHLGLSQVVTRFGRRDTQLKIAQSAVSSAQSGVEQVRGRLAFQAAQVFYTALFLREQVATLDAEVENLQEHLKVTLIKEQTGSANRLEVLGTQVRLASLRSQRADVEGQLQRQTIALRQLAGLDPGQALTLSGTLAPGGVPEDAQSLVDSALQARPEIRQAIDSENAAELGRRLALASAYPTISASGTLGYKTGQMPDINKPSLAWNAGVQLSVPLFQGFQVARSVGEAESKLEAAKANTSAVRQTVTTQVLQAHQDLLNARQQVAISATALAQAREMVEVAKLQYDIGVITNLEYLDAQSSRETASISNLSATYREVLAGLALQQAIGDEVPRLAAP